MAFGATGIVTTDVTPNAGDWVHAVAVQTDGKIVAAGASGVVRYNSDGSLDPSFGNGGLVTVPGGITDVEIQADGKIVVGGGLVVGGNSDFMVRRFDASGAPDLTFHGDGMATLDFKRGSRDGITGISLQPPDINGQQKIIAVGFYDTGVTAPEQWTVLRFNANGTLDNTFDSDGKLTTTFGKGQSRAIPNGVMVLPDGKILVVGESIGSDGWFDSTLVRYNLNGSLDTTFGQGGKVLTDYRAEHTGTLSSDRARDIARQADGKLVVVGSTYDGWRDYFAIARYDQFGKLDPSFAGDGKQILDSPVGDGGLITFKSVVIQPDNKIVAGGSGYFAYVTRFNPNGTLDGSFDGDGWQTFLFSDPPADPHTEGDIVALQTDGKILIGGAAASATGNNYALARLNSDGRLDATPLVTNASTTAATTLVTSLEAELNDSKTLSSRKPNRLAHNLVFADIDTLFYQGFDLRPTRNRSR